MNTQAFSTELLDELGVEPFGESVESSEIIDQLRWADVHRLVFRYGGKLWAVDYYSGSTEEQESGWGYGEYPEFVRAIEVEPYEVTVTRYRAAKS